MAQSTKLTTTSSLNRREEMSGGAWEHIASGRLHLSILLLVSPIRTDSFLMNFPALKSVEIEILPPPLRPHKRIERY